MGIEKRLPGTIRQRGFIVLPHLMLIGLIIALLSLAGASWWASLPVFLVVNIGVLGLSGIVWLRLLDDIMIGYLWFLYMAFYSFVFVVAAVIKTISWLF